MKKSLIYIVTGILYVLFSGNLNAQSVAQEVLDDVVISKSGFTGIIKIKFRIPMRYISHNPKKIGNEIRIKVDFLNGGARSGVRDGELNLRESLVPRYKYSFGLEEVSYETASRENYLTLYFKDNVSFEIIQDASYRSLSIIIHDVKE